MTDIRQGDIEELTQPGKSARLTALEMADKNVDPASDARGDKVLRLARRYLKFLEGK